MAYSVTFTNLTMREATLLKVLQNLLRVGMTIDQVITIVYETLRTSDKG